MMAAGRLAKEIHRTQKSIRHFSDGQAAVSKWDTDNIRSFQVLITPNSGPYKGGKFEFEIQIPDNYPNVCPAVTCLTQIYHPNIDTSEVEENTCINILGDEWEPTYTLEDCIQGLLFLIHNPNLLDPLSNMIDPLITTEEFEKNVRLSLLGKSIDDDYHFPRNFYDEDGHLIPETEIALSEEIISAEERNNDINSNLTEIQLRVEVEGIVEALNKEKVVEISNGSLSNEADDSIESNLSILFVNTEQSNENIEACAVQDSGIELPPLITRQLSKQERVISAHKVTGNFVPLVQDCEEQLNIDECSTKTVYQDIDGLMPVTNLITHAVNDLFHASFKL